MGPNHWIASNGIGYSVALSRREECRASGIAALLCCFTIRDCVLASWRRYDSMISSLANVPAISMCDEARETKLGGFPSIQRPAQPFEITCRFARQVRYSSYAWASAANRCQLMPSTMLWSNMPIWQDSMTSHLTRSATLSRVLYWRQEPRSPMSLTCSDIAVWIPRASTSEQVRQI